MVTQDEINFAIDCFNNKKIALLDEERQIILNVIDDYLIKNNQEEFWAILQYDRDYLISHTGKVYLKKQNRYRKINAYGFFKIKTKFVDIKKVLAENFFGYCYTKTHSAVRINLDNGFNLNNIKYILNAKNFKRRIKHNYSHFK